MCVCVCVCVCACACVCTNVDQLGVSALFSFQNNSSLKKKVDSMFCLIAYMYMFVVACMYCTYIHVCMSPYMHTYMSVCVEHKETLRTITLSCPSQMKDILSSPLQPL